MGWINIEGVINGNRALAVLDGKKFSPWAGNMSWDKQFDTYEECLGYIKDEKLIGAKPQLGHYNAYGSYHKDWHWLMPVVHKIYDMTDDNEKSFSGQKIFELGLATPLEEVWQACVDFAKYWNEKHPTLLTKTDAQPATGQLLANIAEAGKVGGIIEETGLTKTE